MGGTKLKKVVNMVYNSQFPPNIEFVDCLKMFNRKERYWLLHNALGSNENFTLPISCQFWETIKEFSGFSASATADKIWWAMDYHLDWIAGAMRLYREGAASNKAKRIVANLITGSQEDVDLILAYQNNILLIEAKFDSSWDKRQNNSKNERMKALNEYATECGLPIIKQLYMSPRSIKSDFITPHCPMQVPDPTILPSMFFSKKLGMFCKVVRCYDNDASSNDQFTCWKIDTAFARPNN